MQRNARIEKEHSEAQRIYRLNDNTKKANRAEAGHDSRVMRAGFDKVVEASKGALKEGTFELRRPKVDMRVDRRAMCWECGLVFCTCPENISIAYQHAVMPSDDEDED